MSYDLMVFDPEAAPRGHREFLSWFLSEMEADDGICYMDSAIATEPLRTWYREITKLFPSLNGPDGKDELPEDEACACDYSIGKHAIYACFAWSKVEPAYRAVFELAAKHKVGFFNVSSNEEEVWLPSERGLVLAHKRGLLDRIGRIFGRR